MSEDNVECFSRVVPSSWAIAPLSAILSPMETANPAKSGPGDFSYVDIEAIDNVTQRIVSPKRLPRSSAPSRARHVIRENDVIISLVRPRLKNIAIVPHDLDIQWASTAFSVCRPRIGIDSRYLYYMFVQDEFVQAIKTYGDSPPAGHDDDLFATNVPIAPSFEQTRIADRIDELFTDLAAGVAALERIKRNLSRYRAAVLHAAVTGRLTESWRNKHGPPSEPGPKLLERILAERRSQWEQRTLAKYEKECKKPPKNWRDRYPEPSLPKPTPGSVLPRLPSEWTWGSVAQVSSKVVDGVHHKPDYVASGVPFVTVKNLTAGLGIDLTQLNYVTEMDHADFSKRADPERGDVLISKDGTLGVVRIIDTDARFSIFVSVALVKPMMPLTGEYLSIALASPFVQSQMVPKGSGLQHIHLEDLREDPIPIPPLSEQSAITEIVNEKLSQLAALESEVDQGLARAGRLRQSILKAAFEGKLVAQDPSDEPASVLLERIGADASTIGNRNNGDAAKSRKRATKSMAMANVCSTPSLKRARKTVKR